MSLAVAAAVYSVALDLSAAGRDWGGAGVPGEVPVGGESLRAGGVADDDRGGDGAAAGLGGQLGRVRVDQGGELGAGQGVDVDLEFDMVARQPVKSAGEFNNAVRDVKPGDSVMLLVKRDQATQFVTITVPKAKNG